MTYSVVQDELKFERVEVTDFDKGDETKIKTIGGNPEY